MTVRVEVSDLPHGAYYQVWLDGEDVSRWCTGFEYDEATGKGWVRLYDNVSGEGLIQLPLSQSKRHGTVRAQRTGRH